MSARVTFAIAVRVLSQLRRDPRTIALLILVPCVLVTLVRYVVDRDVGLFQRVGVPLVGLFPLISMFLVTSITMLRERSSGTLERLLTLPLSRLDILLGYAIAFAGVAAVQTAAVSGVAFGALGLDSNGPLALVVAFALLNALLGMALGLFVSAFATTEFQAVQFLPAFLLPQLLLCGLLVPRDGMTPVLRWLSNVLPMTYAYDALHRVAIDGTSRRLAVDAIVLGGFMLAALGAGAVTLRRRTA
jgi:ABC-2 type transport system permease protein